MEIRPATFDDASQAAALDGHLADKDMRTRIAAGEVVVGVEEGSLLGILRFQLLWSLIPFIAQVRVVSDARRRGIAKELVGYLEDKMKREGHTMLLSSATADEPEAQAWHMAVGFTPCGFVFLSSDRAGELWFRKSLGTLVE